MPRKQAMAKNIYQQMRGNQRRAAAAGADKAAAMHGAMAEGIKKRTVERVKKDPTFN